MSTNSTSSGQETGITNFMIEFVLMHIIRCEEVFRVAYEHLEPAHLSEPGETPYRSVWLGIREYYEKRGALPTYNTLSTQVLESLKRSHDVLPQSLDDMLTATNMLMEWMYDREKTPDSKLDPVAALETLQEILIDRTAAQRLKRAVLSSSDGHIRHLTTLVEHAHHEIQQIQSACQPQSVPLLGDGLDAYHQRLERHRGRQLIGLKTGMPILDDRLCGVRDFLLLGAAPGVGKSVYCLQITAGVCRHSVEHDNNACALYLSLDMDADDVKDRLHCYLAGIDWKTYRLGSAGSRGNPEGPLFNEGHQQRLEAAGQKISQWQLDRRLAIVGRDEVGQLTTARIAGMSRALKARTGAQHCLIIVDYMQLLPVSEEVARQGDLEADKYRIRMIQQVLDASKDEHDRPRDAAIVISEARKPSTTTLKHSWGHKVEDLMGSARLGYAADAVLLMRPMGDTDIRQHYKHRVDPESCMEDLEREGISPLVMILAKGRDGMIRGSWPAEFHFNESRISEDITTQPQSGTMSLTQRERGSGQQARSDPRVDVSRGLEDVD